MAASGPKCPFCKREITQSTAFSPFCSERCKVNDLGSWASEKYRIPAEAIEAEDSSESRETQESDQSEERQILH